DVKAANEGIRICHLLYACKFWWCYRAAACATSASESRHRVRPDRLIGNITTASCGHATVLSGTSSPCGWRVDANVRQGISRHAFGVRQFPLHGIPDHLFRILDHVLADLFPTTSVHARRTSF